ncbi:MAG TPA: glycosyltransferase family 87 protein [Phenylobacterium sp.]|uniref:glycosyltransferase family 87 protein n=1 Tax=Phenylobacterium sp. TaxID=1871053 RepID=UPI002B474CDE|nr:glycosyltransferase family 87 protein [Phenylobacterium sp.]HKR89974.1 glycosyltransferase family 87 protein [Phenylobacterium sp.]
MRIRAHFRPDLLLKLAALAALLAAVVWAYLDLYALTQIQAPGADYSCFWAGAKTALSEPARIYDFRHISALQGWPLGVGRLRPYVYPPTALFVFAPFALAGDWAGYWTGYGLWVALTGALFLWAAARIGAPWPLVLLAPPVLLTAQCGQVTLLIGGLVLMALSLRGRPLLAGVLLGLAASVKPQFMILVPLALLAEGRWRTILAAGATGLGLCLAAAAVWGVQTWADWLAALPRFNAMIFHDRGLTEDAVTPFAALVATGRNGAWAFLLGPLAAALVWFGFRRTDDLAERSLVLFGATLLVTPYAMNYELALFAPGLAAHLRRPGDPRWPRYAAAAFGWVLLPWAFPSVLPALALGAAPLLRPELARERAKTDPTSNHAA